MVASGYRKMLDAGLRGNAEQVLAATIEAGFMMPIVAEKHHERVARMIDIVMKGAWESPAALELFSHVACDVARLPVREVISGAHFVADLTLDLGEVVFDYLAEK